MIVIVTTAVNLYLYSQLSLEDFIDKHLADVRPYTSSYDFAKSCVFDKQSQPLF